MASRAILLIADAFHPSELPPESRTNTYLALALGKRGWDVAVWAGMGACVPASSTNVKIVGSANFWGISQVLRVLFWVAVKRPQKIIIMYHSVLYSLSSALNYIPLGARILGVRCVTLFTNGRTPNRSAAQDRIFRFLGYKELLESPVGALGLSDRMIFYCDADRKTVLGSDTLNLKAQSAIASPPKTLPSQDSVDRIRNRESLRLCRSAFWVGYFGLIYPGKGIEWLFDAVHIIRKERKVNCRILIIGANGAVTSDQEWNAACRDYESFLRAKAADLCLEDVIIWGGFCKDETASKYLSSCDVVCLPFDDGLKGLRSSFIECASIGLPVITTLSAETDAFLRGEGTGITYVDPRSPTQIADSIVSFYESEELREGRVAILRKFAEEKFRNERFVELFERD